MKKQFENVANGYGAPMGRANYGANCVESAPAKSVRLFRVNLDSGGYDDGGAYWGIGAPIYCALCEVNGNEFRLTRRASSRFHAAALLEIKPSQLKIKLSLPGAYRVNEEYCGYDTPRHVLRLWGEWLSTHETYDAAILAAMEHYTTKARNHDA